MRGILETLRRWWRELLGKPVPQAEEPRPPIRPRLTPQEVQRRVAEGRRRAQRGTSQHTGWGMRKLTRRRAGRQHERRMGVDHNLRMEDVEPKRRKRR